MTSDQISLVNDILINSIPVYSNNIIMTIQANRQRVCVDVPKDLLRDFKRAIFESTGNIQKGDLTDYMIDAMVEWSSPILRSHGIKPTSRSNIDSVMKKLRDVGEPI